METLTPAMKSRLAANRDGKLTTDQWKAIVTEPLAAPLLLMVPIIIFLRARMFYLLVGGGWWIGLLLVILGVGYVALRAARYARAPLQAGVFRAGDKARPVWMMWRADPFEDSSGRTMRFNKRLAPYTRPEPGTRYLIYYLQDGTSRVLLSMIPLDHPEIDRWQPTSTFQARLVRRGGK
jgi:hypothetical protein